MTTESAPPPMLPPVAPITFGLVVVTEQAEPVAAFRRVARFPW